MSGETLVSTPFTLLHKPGGRPILHRAGGRPLLSGTALASGTVPTSGGTSVPPKVTGLAVESLSGGDLVTHWDAYRGQNGVLPEGALYYRQEASTDGGATWESWGRVTETRFSKGGLPNGPRLVRVVAMTGQTNGADDIAGSASEPLSVTSGEASASPPGASTGGQNTSSGAQPLDPGSGGSGGTGTPSGGTSGETPVSPMPAGASAGGTLTLATSVRVPSAGASGETLVSPMPVVRFLQGFAPGEMGDGDRLVATLADGTPVPLRPSARRRTWAAGMGGGVRSRTYDATLPGTYTAGQTVALTLTKQTGAADLGTAKTLAAMAQDSDLKVKFYGYDLGPDVFWVKARDLIQGGAPSIPYGVNPLRGLDIISANQERVSARGWAFVKTDDGRIHRTLKGFLYFDWVRGGGGGYLCGVAWRQDTAYGSHPAGTVGPTDGPKRLRFIVELYDGDRRLHAWGGPNDVRARTVDATALANNLYAVPSGQPLGLDWDGGVCVGVQGANLPSGLSAASAYYVRRVDGGVGFFSRRRDGNTRVSWSGGSGNITVFPVMHSYAGQGGYGLDTDGGRVWSGAGAKPEAWFAPDQPHLFKRTRLVPPYGDHVNRAAMGGTPTIYTPGEVYSSVIWAIQSPSDDPEASRLGPVPYYHARWLMTPHDPVARSLSLRQAASWADFPTWFSDERSGCPVVTSFGPNGDGVTYPGLGPVNPGFSFILNDVNGSPGFGQAQHDAWRGAADNKHGYDEDYQQANTFAHTPNFWQIAHLLTGDQMWLDMGAASCAAAGYLWGHGQSIGGKEYSPVLRGQQRGVAWALREWSNYDGQSPDDDPLRVLFADYLRINGEFYATYSRTAQARHLGKPYLPGENNDVGGRPFQEYMLAFMCGMHLWRTQDANWREFMDCTGRFIIGAFDDFAGGGTSGETSFRPSNRGWLANEYGLHGNDFQNVLGRGAASIWASTEEMLRYSNEPAFGITQAGPAPYPQYGLRRDDNDFNNATYRFNAIAYVHMLVGALAVWSSAGIPNAKRVREQILRRIYDGTLKEIPVNSTVGPIPQYACVPVPGSPD